MYSTVKMENNIARKNEKEKLLEKYDKEFGLELGSNKELVENMNEEPHTVFKETEKQYSIAAKHFMDTLNCFIYGTRPYDDRDYESDSSYENQEAQEDIESDNDEDRDTKIGYYLDLDFVQHFWIKPSRWEYLISSIYALFTKKKNN